MADTNRLNALIEQWDRRRFLKATAIGAAAFTTPGAFAELLQTPRLAEGPFYPDKLPLDTDNDLIVINDSTTPAVGQITHLTGKVLDSKGSPVRNALVEIWQCDNNGIYMHSRDRNQDKRDTHFQSYGKFLTSSTGEYYFRTIKPSPYVGRTPHIHYKITRKGEHLLTTQLLNANEKEANEKDGLFRRVKDEKKRAALMTEFKPIKDSELDELAANWDVVLGWTPADED
ncbi:MAG: twin-arginine translocation signal domain-containing protein [Planctomycetota bacterium]